LECPRGCDASCHACLLDFDTQHEASKLNRHEALKLLSSDVEAAMELPTDLRILGSMTRFEFNSLPTAIAQELERADINELRIYLGGETSVWDPSDWSLRKPLLKWSTTNRKLRLFLPDRVISALTSEQLADLANIVEAGEIEVWSLVGTSTGVLDSALIAEVGGTNRSARWAVTNPASKAPNQFWGAITGEDRIVRAAEPAPLGSPRGSLVRFGSLRKAPPGSNTELRLMREVDGSSQQLSHKSGKSYVRRSRGLISASLEPSRSRQSSTRTGI
jgi:hypothetical protein